MIYLLDEGQILNMDKAQQLRIFVSFVTGGCETGFKFWT
jgi:hypothetical protein